MIDFEFGTELREHRFASRGHWANNYNFTNLRDSNILAINPKMVPIIKLQGGWGNPKQPLDVLQYTDLIQFRGAGVTKDKFIEIVNRAHFIMSVKKGTEEYYAGKGFIGIKITSGHILPLMVVTVPEADYTDNEETDLTLLIDPRFADQPAVIKSVIQTFIRGHMGDIITTKFISRYLAGKIKLPQFASIRAKKEFTDNFMEECVRGLHV